MIICGRLFEYINGVPYETYNTHPAEYVTSQLSYVLFFRTVSTSPCTIRFPIGAFSLLMAFDIQQGRTRSEKNVLDPSLPLLGRSVSPELATTHGSGNATDSSSYTLGIIAALQSSCSFGTIRHMLASKSWRSDLEPTN